MEDNKEKIPSIVSRVTLGNEVFYYCDDGNVYVIDSKKRKLNKIGENRQDIVMLVKSKFVKADDVKDDVINTKDYDEMER